MDIVDTDSMMRTRTATDVRYASRAVVREVKKGIDADEVVAHSRNLFAVLALRFGNGDRSWIPPSMIVVDLDHEFQ